MALPLTRPEESDEETKETIAHGGDRNDSADAEFNKQAELTVFGPGGLGARAKGYRLMDMVCLGSFILTCYITYAVADHKTDVRIGDTRLLTDVRESLAATAKSAALSNAQVVDALRENTSVSRDTNRAIRELVCINTLPISARRDGSETCRRAAASIGSNVGR